SHRIYVLAGNPQWECAAGRRDAASVRRGGVRRRRAPVAAAGSAGATPDGGRGEGTAGRLRHAPDVPGSDRVNTTARAGPGILRIRPALPPRTAAALTPSWRCG